MYINTSKHVTFRHQSLRSHVSLFQQNAQRVPMDKAVALPVTVQQAIRNPVTRLQEAVIANVDGQESRVKLT